MKAVRYHACGEADVLRWEDSPNPVPGADEVLMKVEAAGVNYADLMRRSGRYHFKIGVIHASGFDLYQYLIGILL